MVTAQAVDKTGRQDESTGMVDISNLKGQNLANAFMKAETKAKRRVTLSICGLGMLDESEIEDIQKEAKDVTAPQTHFLPDTKPNHDALIQAFMGLGVSKGDIIDLYKLDDIEELTEDMVTELRGLYKEAKAGSISLNDYFNAHKDEHIEGE